MQPIEVVGYGVDEEYTTLQPQDDNQLVTVDSIRVSLSEYQLQLAHQLISSLQEQEDDFGIVTFVRKSNGQLMVTLKTLQSKQFHVGSTRITYKLMVFLLMYAVV